MELYINTQNKDLIEVCLKKGNEVLDKTGKQHKIGSQVLLPLIINLLKKNRLTFKDLKGIKVKTGPGSFTGIRVGVSVANALAYSLGIPVNGKSMETDLQYDVSSI